MSSVLKESQLGSSVFDDEIKELLLSQLLKVFEPFGGSFARSWRAELELLLNSSLFFLSVYDSGTTYGQKLHNVTYAPTTKIRRLALGGMSVLIPYAWNYAPSSNVWVQRVEKLVRTVSWLNFVAFLWQGKYPQLPERILGIEMKHLSFHRSRSVAFDFMNRQLVWQGFTEFILFVAPLINFQRLQKLFRRTVANPTIPSYQCGICGVSPVQNPYGSSDCKHACCYYCIAAKLEEDSDASYPCPKCGKTISKTNLVPIVDRK